VKATPASVSRVPVRADLVGVEPYGAPQLDVPVRLNTNETPMAPPRSFSERLAERIVEIPLHRYPDRRAWALRSALGARFGLPPERVWAANGSNEVLLQLFQAYGGPGRTLLLTRPGYSAHPLIARVAGTATVAVDLEPSDFSLSPDAARRAVAAHDPDLVCLATPNNPTGALTSHETLRALHDSSRALVIVDEAYVELAPEGSSAVGLLDQLPRLVVCRTFSKAWRMAGLRLGYLLAHRWVVDDLRKVRLPYHLDALTQEAGLLALEMAGEVTAHLADLVAGRQYLHTALTRMQGVEVWPSAANYLLFRVVDVPDLFDRLLAQGVLVRDFTTAPGTPGCLRVTVGTPWENDRFLDALRSVLGHPATTPQGHPAPQRPSGSKE